MWGLAAPSSKANKQASWWKGKFALFQMPATRRGRAFIDRVGVLPAGTA